MEGQPMKRVVWIRWLFAVITAVVVSLIIFSATYRQDSVESCMRASGRSNAEAKNWEYAARARRQDGDYATAREYTTNVKDLRAHIAMPDGWKGDPMDRGKSDDDREQGCHDAFDPLIPFVR
jgi:hypothetical protein